jgi:hypothetical protein
LARKHQTDKGGGHLVYGGEATDTCHNYTPAYHDLFGQRRDEVRRVLEVGINRGCSLRMWEEYFPRADIIGLDIDPATLFRAGRIRCYQADQGVRQSLQAAIAAAGGGTFDLIIDDGSHHPLHQVITAETLLSIVAPGGTYVIEDLEVDCRPDLLAGLIRHPAGMAWRAVPCGHGIGPKAACRALCQFCGGTAGEQLLVYRWGAA